jgi:hypothetical protein
MTNYNAVFHTLPSKMYYCANYSMVTCSKSGELGNVERSTA